MAKDRGFAAQPSQYHGTESIIYTATVSLLHGRPNEEGNYSHRCRNGGSRHWEVAALAGYSVTLLIDSAGDVFGRIETETDTTTALESIDIVIEVVPENMELK